MQPSPPVVLPEYLKDRTARTLWSADGEWMGHRIDSPTLVRNSALFPAFEADAMTAMIEREPVGEDNVADFILLNRVILKACQPQLAQRYASAAELRAALLQVQTAIEGNAPTQQV